jgi:hypothetical protein
MQDYSCPKQRLGKTIQQWMKEAFQRQVQLQPPETEGCGSDQRPRQQERPVCLEWRTEITTLG